MQGWLVTLGKAVMGERWNSRKGKKDLINTRSIERSELTNSNSLVNFPSPDPA